MGAIEGFSDTWAKARGTFGQGVPDDGTQFDLSPTFRRLQGDVESAAPDADWTGSGSDAYAATNAKHAQTLDGLADTDRRLATEVANSAAVVTTGREDLEAVRQWVADAAAQLPDNAAGERALWQVVGKGSGDVADIITRSHGDLSAIGERIRGLGEEYDRLGTSPEGDGVQMVNFHGEGDEDLDRTTPYSTLDLTALLRLPPFDPNDRSTYPPPFYMELAPHSGVWVPDPNAPGSRPRPPKAPLDYKDIQYWGPGTPGPPDHMELIPGSGAWVPDPTSPNFRPHIPEVPVDLKEVQFVDPNGLLPLFTVELWPHSGITIPDPNAGHPF